MPQVHLGCAARWPECTAGVGGLASALHAVRCPEKQRCVTHIAATWAEGCNRPHPAGGGGRHRLLPGVLLPPVRRQAAQEQPHTLQARPASGLQLWDSAAGSDLALASAVGHMCTLFIRQVRAGAFRPHNAWALWPGPRCCHHRPHIQTYARQAHAAVTATK